MSDRDELLKQASITIQRVYDLLYGEGNQCVHCGQKVGETHMGDSIYARVEDLEKCTASPTVSRDGKRYWCRQFQGKIPPESEFMKTIIEESTDD